MIKRLIKFLDDMYVDRCDKWKFLDRFEKMKGEQVMKCKDCKFLGKKCGDNMYWCKHPKLKGYNKYVGQSDQYEDIFVGENFGCIFFEEKNQFKDTGEPRIYYAGEQVR